MKLLPQDIGAALVCAVFAVAFLQSGIDKISDRKGNLEWLSGHFANSPLKGMVAPLLSLVTLLELVSGAAAAIAIVAAFVPDMRQLVVWALALCGLTLLALFSGQRIAKDYPGAATIATYFAVLLFGFVFAH